MAAIRPFTSTHDPTIVVVWSKLASGTVYPTMYRWAPLETKGFQVWMKTWRGETHTWLFETANEMKIWLERQYRK